MKLPKVNLKNKPMRKYSVHVLGENPSGFWNCTTYWNTKAEARLQAGKELVDDEVYSVWIVFPDGREEYVLNDEERSN